VPRAVQAKIETGETWPVRGGDQPPAAHGHHRPQSFCRDVFFSREIVMLGAALISWKFTPKFVHEENHFSFGPIKEVAFLFVGIFLTMMPALAISTSTGADFGVTKPIHYYVAARQPVVGARQCPDLCELPATRGDDGPGGLCPQMRPRASRRRPKRVAAMRANPAEARLIIAVSLGAVFFWAMTYIGNGPNFMVKSIAESAGVKVPTFVGYI